MTRVSKTSLSKILIAGGAIVALALSTGSAWAPIYMNNTKTSSPKLNIKPPTSPATKNSTIGSATGGAGAGKTGTGAGGGKMGSGGGAGKTNE